MNIKIEERRIEVLQSIQKDIEELLSTYKESMEFSEKDATKINDCLNRIKSNMRFIENTHMKIVSSAGTKLTIM